MEKERRIKIISAIALIVAVLGLTVAFAVLSTNLVINGTAKVDPGKWDIHFEELSNATTKGGATVEGAAKISDTNTTKIEGINVTLTKPMDEVIYKVDLVNKGDIDAEISNINLPTFSEEEQKYIEFSARYDDKKEITKGDILRGGATEIVTISIKFKKEVTELPGEDLNVNLSYEINYVQTDKKDEEVHKGEVPPVDYDSLDVGDELSLGKEEFYVIENNDTELKLLAKYRLLVGYTCVEGSNCELISKETEGYGRQSSTAIDTGDWYEPDIGVIEFQSYESFDERRGYWAIDNDKTKPEYGGEYPAYVYDSNSNLYQYVEAYKSYLKDDLKYDIKEARLMKLEEVIKLGGISFEKYKNIYFSNSAPGFLDSSSFSYWIGDAGSMGDVFAINPRDEDRRGFLKYDSTAYNEYLHGIRPVIVLNK